MKQYECLLVEPYLEYRKFLTDCATKVYPSDIVLHSHHIVPKSLGGTNAPENLINLSVDDHITAHRMLAQCFTSGTDANINNLRSMRVLSKNSLKLRDEFEKISEAMRGENNHFFGKTHTTETRARLSAATKKARTGVEYDKFYKTSSRATTEKDKRRSGVTNYWQNVDESEKATRSQHIKDAMQRIPPEKRAARSRAAAIADQPLLQINGLLYETYLDAMQLLGVKTRYQLNKQFTIIKLKKDPNETYIIQRPVVQPLLQSQEKIHSTGDNC